MVRCAVLASSLLLAAAARADGDLPPAAPAPTPAGYTIDESGCASGGPAYHFFAGGAVLLVGCGDECPFIAEGRWSQGGEQGITVQLKQAYVGRGDTPVQAAARTEYARYTAAVRAIDQVETMLWNGGDGCTVVRRHALPSSSARAWLRGAFRGDHPFLFDRAITAGDLAGRSKDELRRMRNELFAAYGYIFRDEALRAHFQRQPGYAPRFVDVTAFLSPLERENLRRIEAAERSR